MPARAVQDAAGQSAFRPGGLSWYEAPVQTPTGGGMRMDVVACELRGGGRPGRLCVLARGRASRVRRAAAGGARGVTPRAGLRRHRPALLRLRHRDELHPRQALRRVTPTSAASPTSCSAAASATTSRAAGASSSSSRAASPTCARPAAARSARSASLTVVPAVRYRWHLLEDRLVPYLTGGVGMALHRRQRGRQAVHAGRTARQLDHRRLALGRLRLLPVAERRGRPREPLPHPPEPDRRR